MKTTIDTGKMARDYISENRLSKSSLARSMGLTPKNFMLRLNNENMTADFIMKLSHVSNHNFFYDMALMMDVLPVLDNEEIIQLKNEIEILNREKELLRDIIISRV